MEFSPAFPADCENRAGHLIGIEDVDQILHIYPTVHAARTA
ncbi:MULTISPECIES: hypothetical protein [unclassified Streptomyces]|nr:MULTISPECIES: hypothetical protein [unclassified Streptomyces]SCK63337.1 hypothetical protein YUWDRAFT_06911 [Streptomyces sp. AmelKG-D3]